MPSIINSDDGVVSGTSGLKTTGGNDGLLNIQSNGSTVVAVTGSGISVTGTVSQTGVSTFAAGTASAPSITFTGDTNTGIFSPAADTIAFTEGGVESMRIDASGNVGVGVTPSAWSTSDSVRAIQTIGSTVIWNFATNNSYFGNNYYWNGTNRIYLTNSAATEYRSGEGVHTFASASSGTAGNAVAFTNVLSVEKDKSLALQGASTQSGTGITFPATQSASSDANTLDDYEEGTFTPTLAGGFSSGPTSYTTQLGRYTKIGRFVYIEVFIDPVGATGNASRVIFGGLPFTAAGGATTTNGGGFIVYQALFNTNAGDALVVQPSNTTIDFYTNAGASRNGNDANVNINEQIRFNAVYVV